MCSVEIIISGTGSVATELVDQRRSETRRSPLSLDVALNFANYAILFNLFLFFFFFFLLHSTASRGCFFVWGHRILQPFRQVAGEPTNAVKANRRGPSDFSWKSSLATSPCPLDLFFGSVCAGPNTDEAPVGDREGNSVELVHSGKRSQRLLLVTGSVDVD